MTTYDWQTIRTNAISKLGETPGPQIEQDIIDHFKTEPVLVIETIERVHADREHGKPIHSPWAVIHHRLDQPAPSPVTATDDRERTKRVKAAEHWIHNAGVYIDRQPELEDELFGPVGRLRNWNTDTKLHDRMLTLWQERRPAGQAAETEALERHAQHIATRNRLQQLLAAKKSTEPEDPPDPDLQDPGYLTYLDQTITDDDVAA